MNTIKLYASTLRYLRWIQIYYRLYYFVRTKYRSLRGFRYPLSLASQSHAIELAPSIPSAVSFKEGEFLFLNRSYACTQSIAWNFSEHGKLWNYNLAYFEYLNQESMSREEGLHLIESFIEHSPAMADAMEPFPLCLRGLNWIKFLRRHDVRSQKIDDSLYAQYRILLDNLEYHLLGNHLLENGFSLLFGALYFDDALLYNKAETILRQELNEQILNDGAHFELSPMYHQIMLFRLLDAVNLLHGKRQKNQEALLGFLEQKASLMLGWLKNLTFNDGSIPLFNDSATAIAPHSAELFDYAARLGVEVQEKPLCESGYRRVDTQNYSCIVDVGNIGPDYIPGHAHADTFGFELHRDNAPFIVDSGLSTYETNARRSSERSSQAHNTVTLSGQSQSEMWGSFRVAERAHVISLQESSTFIRAIHNGYKKRLNALHEREFAFEDEGITITDRIISQTKHPAVARLHFHPSVDEETIVRHVCLDDLDYTIKEYFYAPQFNLLQRAKVLEVAFVGKLELRINL